MTLRALFLCALGAFASRAAHSAARETVALDGTWQIEDSVSSTTMPTAFGHAVPVPGLADMSVPPFKDVDLFDSRELSSNRIRTPGSGVGESSRIRGAGVPRQARNYFWYRRTFRAPKRRASATLRVGKAQFGTAVWLNGRAIGEHAGCFTAGYFDMTGAIRWGEDNVLIVRVGAHPAVLPDTVPTGTDFEKLKWTPGIYDGVSARFADEPEIVSVQVAPRIASSEIVVQTRLRNRGAAGRFTLRQRVRPWRGGGASVDVRAEAVALDAGEEREVLQTIRIPDARLWSPEDPYLYALDTETDGDSESTRFGMREFRGDAATKRLLLNGQPRYLRGSNVTLHRFFEDPQRGDLPWNEAWVRKLLVDVPKRMHWDSMRFCIGPVPDKWLEIADEAGLLIQNEFFVWTGAPDWDKRYARYYDAGETVRQYSDWMRDNWNHPSVVIWDANNETLDPLFGDRIIPAVRGLDLSDRPWENSFNQPAAPDDPQEDHVYFLIGDYLRDEKKFEYAQLEALDGSGGDNGTQSTHPRILNEYAWVWLTRGGLPTPLTENVYPRLLGRKAGVEELLAHRAYWLAAETEFWRAHRKYAGVLHFVYLTGDNPGAFTSDHWRDVKGLELEPEFERRVGEAFKPLGVYLNFFQPRIAGGERREFKIMMVNDLARPARGVLTLTLESSDGESLASSRTQFSLTALGDASYSLTLDLPVRVGPVVLKAVAHPEGSGDGEATTSLRRTSLLIR
ncbi:MAG: hypothetical protein HY078_15260 [Elusimicrobia bacterium]|nr:hypothetical protein [Elusimicrobiota bacterium]